MSSASSTDDNDVDVGDDDGAAYYDNSKRPRSGLWFGGDIRYPGEVLSSMSRDVTTIMVRDFVFALFCFQFGMRGPTMFVLPLIMGGSMTMRPIPFQVTRAGDVLLDLTLSNEYVPKSDVTFPCESFYTYSIFIYLVVVSFALDMSCIVGPPPRHLSVTPSSSQKRPRSSGSELKFSRCSLALSRAYSQKRRTTTTREQKTKKQKSREAVVHLPLATPVDRRPPRIVLPPSAGIRARIVDAASSSSTRHHHRAIEQQLAFERGRRDVRRPRRDRNIRIRQSDGQILRGPPASELLRHVRLRRVVARVHERIRDGDGSEDEFPERSQLA